MIKYIQNLLQGAPVQWKPLGEVTEYEQPTPYLVKSSNYNDFFATPVLTAGKTFILGYTDETTGIYRASRIPVIIFDDFTTANKWVDFDFKAKSSAMKMIRSKDESKVLLRYIYYWMNTLPSDLVAGDHKRQWISNFSLKRIPVPPMAVQEEIVRILDKFTTLEAELEAELDCRKRQYEFYRDRLFSFDTLIRGGQSQNNIILKSLGDIADIGTGKSNRQDEVENGEYPFYVRSKEVLRSNTFQFDETAIIIPGEGGIGDIFHYVQGKYALHQRAYRIHLHNSRVLTKFLYYYFTSEFKKYINKKSVGATATSIRKPMLQRFLIPIPPIEEQARIVEILDKFDTLTTSLSAGLPFEIELRRKQYEYYRDQLLSFPEHKVTAKIWESH